MLLMKFKNYFRLVNILEVCEIIGIIYKMEMYNDKNIFIKRSLKNWAWHSES